MFPSGNLTRVFLNFQSGRIMRGSRIFSRGSRPNVQKTVSTTFFFCLLFCPQLSLQRGSNGFITEKTILFKGSRGGPTFSRGVQLSPGGIQMLISIETYITCDFPGGGGGPDPLSPLWIHTCILTTIGSTSEKEWTVYLSLVFISNTIKVSNCLDPEFVRLDLGITSTKQG